jgi:SAM-dependent methyltransferase
MELSTKVSMAVRVREVARSLVQHYGSRSLRSWLWDRDFSRGRYGRLTSEGDFLYPFLEKYAGGGCILDLGCGAGNTGSELRAHAYAEYIGIDISRVAIVKATARTELDVRSGQNRYFCGDIMTYVPPHKFNVILFRDSIYYVAKTRIKATLERYSNFLVEGGVFILRLYDGLGRYKRIIDEIEKDFTVIQRHVSIDPNAILLVFRGAEQNSLTSTPVPASLASKSVKSSDSHASQR